MGGAYARTGWWSPERDRWIFFGFFVVGVVFILVLKTAVGSQVVATLVPCLFMFWYAGLQWDSRAREPKPDANGDNLYYLGFLYTLTSLGHALYRFSTEQEDTEVIVTNFGIAISTTILGMALRILLGRPGFDDPPAVEASARRDLASAARRLRAELEYAAADFGGFRSEARRDFKDFRERLAQDADSTHAVVAKTIDGLERAIENFEQGTRKAVETIVDRTRELERSAAALGAFEHAVDRLDTRTTAAVEAIGGQSTALATGAAKIGESLKAQAERIGTLDLPKTFGDALQPASTELRAAAAEFRTLVDGLRQADAAREKAAAGYERGLAALNGVLREQETLATAVVAATKETRGAAGSLRAAGDRLSGFNEGAEDAARQVAGVRDELARSAKQLRAVNEELARTSAALESWVGEAREALSRRPRRSFFFRRET